jgi:hypothetical protein
MQQLSDIQQINQSIVFGSFTNTQLDSIISAVKFARGNLAKSNKRRLRIGAQVRWASQRTGYTETGTVEKISIKFITVNTGTMRWKVPANMLEIDA